MAPNSLSTYLFSPPYRFLSPSFSRSHLRFLSAHSFRSSKFTPLNSDAATEEKPPTLPSETRSLAVTTGAIFLGLTTALLKAAETVSGPQSDINGVGMSFDETAIRRVAEYDERIGNVVEDRDEPHVVWEQRIRDVEAEKKRVFTSPGFSFSAAGLLFPYHLGVAQLLIEKGHIKDTTPLAGSSAGAIVCAVIASGCSMHEALRATKLLADDCRRNGTAFRIGSVLRDILDKFLPEDAHTLSNGRIRIAVTQILWRPRSLLIDQFDSKQDLIDAVFTSSFIPGYLAPRPATIFRNQICIDGGLTLLMPPTSADQTIRVCCFPASRLGLKGIGISPDLNPEFRASPKQLFHWALEPAEDEFLDKLFELGYQDAALWSDQNPPENETEAISKQENTSS